MDLRIEKTDAESVEDITAAQSSAIGKESDCTSPGTHGCRKRK